jgi:hypothetical protein
MPSTLAALYRLCFRFEFRIHRGALLSWAQIIRLDGELEKAGRKTVRCRILHAAAVLVRRGHRLILRLDEISPWAAALRQAILRLRTPFP